jgi:hypothetical protein
MMKGTAIMIQTYQLWRNDSELPHEINNGPFLLKQNSMEANEKATANTEHFALAS